MHVYIYTLIILRNSLLHDVLVVHCYILRIIYIHNFEYCL